MIVFINGAFGIGKTSVARELVRVLPGARTLDPEHIGLPIQYAARLIGRDVGDFQDLDAWRRLTVTALGVMRRVAPTIVVPMAISNRRYLGDIWRGAESLDASVHHFCLVAPLSVVEARLRKRGMTPERHAWEFRRAAECCEAHAEDAFQAHLDASTMTPTELAAKIMRACIPEPRYGV